MCALSSALGHPLKESQNQVSVTLTLDTNATEDIGRVISGIADLLKIAVPPSYEVSRSRSPSPDAARGGPMAFEREFSKPLLQVLEFAAGQTLELKVELQKWVVRLWEQRFQVTASRLAFLIIAGGKGTAMDWANCGNYTLKWRKRVHRNLAFLPQAKKKLSTSSR